MRQSGDGSITIARYTLAVDRRYKKDGDSQTADFISCVAFGKNGEFAEKYLKKGMKIGVAGRIQTGSYTNKDGNKVYTTDVIVEEHDFCERKGDANSQSGESNATPPSSAENDGFSTIPDDYEELEFPFC